MSKNKTNFVKKFFVAILLVAIGAVGYAVYGNSLVKGGKEVQKDAQEKIADSLHDLQHKINP